ncbi:hypothetical protein RRG08_059384 [Elysia crispata]|uniref:Uncharacterized protein n=1 Tax=Elysia crispata TaxID=231223 RepID=A0AAE1AXF2_9GAST|nr:hypothetical protein RRG08_059384 [Elysia crispata]
MIAIDQAKDSNNFKDKLQSATASITWFTSLADNTEPRLRHKSDSRYIRGCGFGVVATTRCLSRVSDLPCINLELYRLRCLASPVEET